MKDLKFCVYCKWCLKHFKCGHPDIRDVVRGLSETPCADARKMDSGCGVDGKLYEDAVARFVSALNDLNRV